MAEDEDEQLERYIRKIARDEAARGGGSSGGGGGEVDIGQFGKFIHAAKDMKDALTSDVDKALSGAVSEKIVSQVIPSMSPQPRASAGFWDTNGGVALMNKIGDQIAPLADLVFNKIGSERTGKLVDGFTDTFLGGGKTSEDNLVVSLDLDNPADMHKYMALHNLSDPTIARKTLIEEKQKSMQRLRAGSGAGGDGTGSGGNGGVGIDFAAALETQNAMLREIMKARQEDRAAMLQMWQGMEELKKEQSKIKVEIVNSGKKGEGFNIDTVKDRGVVDKSVVDKSVVDKSVVDKSVVDKSVVDKSVVDKSVVDKSVVDKSVVDKSVVDKSDEDKSDEDKAVEVEKDEDKAVVNKRKGTPKWKENE